MEERVRQLENTVEQLTGFINLLASSGTLPLALESAIRERINPVSGTTSSHDVASKTVHESGSSSYNVAKVYDAMLEVTINGTTYYLGAYTS
jgi:hypothetical protein